MSNDDIEGFLAGLASRPSPPERTATAWSDQLHPTSSDPLPPFLTDSSPTNLLRSPAQQSSAGAIPSRPLSQRRVASTGQVPPLLYGDTAHAPTSSFEPPLRSIFVSGPPTASVSANTAQASLSPANPSSSSGPVAALTSAGGSRRPNRLGELPPSITSMSSAMRHPLLAMEKDVDDPSTNVVGNPYDHPSTTTPAALARLFVTSDVTSPESLSRGPSHILSSGYARALEDTSSLSGHLLQHGFQEGRHSDITVRAFGQSYRLHKILLDRVPYFASAFSGHWAESRATEMTIATEELDPNITKTAFELALKRVYGTQFPTQEEEEATGLFATACWLDMPELVDSCVDNILRQMQPATLHSLIKLVTHYFYGKSGDRILSSAKAMLCKEGWEMPYEYWDDIPAEIVREVVGGDPFFVPGEWERWYLALKLLNRRLRGKAVEHGLVSPGGHFLHTKPSDLRFFAVRSDVAYRLAEKNRYVAPHDEPWIALYTSPEIAPLLVLLDEGIHYVHLRFEQLQQIRAQKDILGIPVLPDKVISDALWMSMEIRQKVFNAHEDDIELGLSEAADTFEEDELDLVDKPTSYKGKAREGSQASRDIGLEDSKPPAWHGNTKPRKFWIPGHDVSCVMGGTREATLAANSTSIAEWSTHAARLSASLEPTDVAWALDFQTANVIDGGRPPSRSHSPSLTPRYSVYPPFRFSAEFPHPRTLKEKKRVYSHTVWYAGSMWNLYIQRVVTSKVPQLGVYLHRAKDKDPCDDPLAQFVPASVDDRIGQLEREMLLRKNERRTQGWRVEETARASDADREDDSAGSPHEFSFSFKPESDSFSGTRRGLERSPKTWQTPGHATYVSQEMGSPLAQMLEYDEEDDELVRVNRKFNISAIPPYMDSRPTIKTYFKIYSPSKAGRLLSIYESAPDKFDVSKSWGWKSSQMVLDDGIGGYDSIKPTKEGKLRYMVVIGNI